MPFIHYVKFERNVITGQWRAACSCMWSDVGDEDQVKREAASHDLHDDWQFEGASSVHQLREQGDE